MMHSCIRTTITEDKIMSKITKENRAAAQSQAAKLRKALAVPNGILTQKEITQLEAIGARIKLAITPAKKAPKADAKLSKKERKAAKKAAKAAKAETPTATVKKPRSKKQIAATERMLAGLAKAREAKAA